jgi:hypothetical protein
MRRGAAARGSNNKGAAAGGPAPPIELYTETNIWSKYYRLWTRWHVKKPRLPLLAEDNPETARWVDLPKNKPQTIAGFTGSHNETVTKTLKNLRETFEDSKVNP